MTDALWEHIAEHGPTWLIVLAMLGVQSWRLYRWMDRKFEHIDNRQDDHERVLLDGGYAEVVEKTDGGHRLVAIHANRRFKNGGEHG